MKVQKTLHNPVIPEGLIPKRHCMFCQKACEGWYGAYAEGGTCSKKCELIQEAKPKYPPPKESP